MDQGVNHALGWVNHWAICGLREAAYAAQQLGRPREVRACLNEADDLQEALVRYARANPSFFEQERSTNSLLWPTWAWANDLDDARAGFDAWYARHREPSASSGPNPTGCILNWPRPIMPCSSASASAPGRWSITACATRTCPGCTAGGKAARGWEPKTPPRG